MKVKGQSSNKVNVKRSNKVKAKKDFPLSFEP